MSVTKTALEMPVLCVVAALVLQSWQSWTPHQRREGTFAMSVGQMSIFSNELSGLKRNFKVNFHCSLIIFLSKIEFIGWFKLDLPIWIWRRALCLHK